MTAELTPEIIASILLEYFARAKVCKKYGIPMIDVVDNGVAVPPGWVFDPMMEYFMPSTLLES